MTASDNRLEAKELIYILEAGMQIGFDRETIIQIGQETELHPLVVPADEAQRMTMLYYLLFLMRIDGHIDPDEEIFAKMFGFKLGFNELMLEELVIVMKDHVNAELPEDLLIEKVRKYLN